MSTKHKKRQIIFVKRRIVRDKTHRYKSCQLYLPENVLQDILPLLLNPQITFLQLLTPMCRSYVHKEIIAAYASQTDLLNLLVLYSELINF